MNYKSTPSLFQRYLVFNLVLCAFWLSSCSSQTKKQIEEEADVYFNMGTNALVNKNYTVALTNLLTASEKSPERSDIHNNLGMAYYFKNQPQLAFKHVKLAVKLDPKNTDAKSNLASLYLDSKQYELAKNEYLEVLKDLTYQKQYVTYYNLGKVEYDQKKFAEAKAYFKQSIRENPNSCAAQYYLGLIEFKDKKYKNAQNYFKDSYYGVCYSNEYPLFYHGLSFEKNGEYDKAIGRYQELIDRFPRSKLVSKANERIRSASILQAEQKPTQQFAKQQGIDDILQSENNDQTEDATVSPEF